MSSSLAPFTTTILSANLLHAWQRCENKLADWTADTARRANERYAKFLLLIADDPCRPYAPTRDIDEMWHLHMLSPVAYHADCMRLFGHLLDHDGGFGQTAEELPELQRVYADTAARWEAKFGEPYADGSYAGVTKCWHDCQSRCWHACSSNVAPGTCLQ